MKDVATKNVSELPRVDKLLNERGGMDDNCRELVDKTATIKMIMGCFFIIIVMRTGILSRPLGVYGKTSGCKPWRRECDFSTLTICFFVLVFRILFLLYRIWSKKYR